MSLTESSTVTKSNVDPDVEVSKGISFNQNIHKEGMSRGTRDTNLASDTEAENTAKRKASERPFGFAATDAATEKPSRKRRLEADGGSEVPEKEGDEYVDFKRFRAVQKNMTSLSGISQKPWLSTKMIISTNLPANKIYRKTF